MLGSLHPFQLLNSPVREGATIWYLKRLVVARAARFTIGTDVKCTYDPSVPHHRERQQHIIVLKEWA